MSFKTAVYIPKVGNFWVIGDLSITVRREPIHRMHYIEQEIEVLNTVVSVYLWWHTFISLILYIPIIWNIFQENETRMITHFELTCWTKDSVPNIRDFLFAMQDIRIKKNAQRINSNTLVHCGWEILYLRMNHGVLSSNRMMRVKRTLLLIKF